MPHSRKLAAIMFTDIQGYTALMQQNEEKALDARKKHRTIFNTATKKHNGRILQYYGDGTLSIFDSAIDAVNCAIEMQLAFQKKPSIPVRIGIHTGDILFSKEDIIGDGVNVASRIESLSVPGSVFISDKVYDEIKNQESIKTAMLDAFKLKNIEQPIKVYAISNVGLKVPKREEVKGKTEEEFPPEKQQTRLKTFSRHKFLIAAATITLIAALLIVFKFKLDLQTTIETADNSIAVLAFENLSGDPEQEYFSDGISEEILNYLAKIEGLKVAGRTSAFSFKGKHEDIRSIGRKLNVRMVLEGSIRKAGNRVRITAQLINVADGFHLWSETYDRELEDIFAVQDDISKKIAAKMKVTLELNERRPLKPKPTANMEAYELLLRGRFHRDRGVEGLEQSLKLFEKVIQLDPNYAQAYLELAETYFSLSIFKFIPQEEGYAKVLEFNRKAVALNPSIPGGHLGMARYHFLATWEWEAALSQYEKEIALGSPPEIFHPLYLAYMFGDFDSAIQEAQTIIAQDPLNIDLLRSLFDLYLMARRYDELRTILDKTLDLNPAYSEALRYYGRSYFYEGNYAEALPYFEKAAELVPRRGFAATDIIMTLAKLGRLDEAKEMFALHQKGISHNTVFAFELAILNYYLGEKDKAFQWLEKSFNKKEFWLVSLKVSPYWDPMRSEPQFQTILSNMNFPVSRPHSKNLD